MQQDGVTYLAHPWFSIYRGSGAVALQQHLVRVIRLPLGGDVTAEATLPSVGRLTLQRQAGSDILHLLYASTVTRGGPYGFAWRYLGG